MTTRPRPRFTGVRTHIDPIGRFTFRYPTGWHQFELEEEREGVMYAPEASNPLTFFAVWATKLETSIVMEDADDLREGIEQGFTQLPEFTVVSSSEATYGNLLKFERIFTFRDDQVIRKRKLWILYVDVWQLVVTFQGETPEEYDHWLPMGNYCLSTFNVPAELWFATDRDLNRPTAA